MFFGPCAFADALNAVGPDYLIFKVIFAEYLIHQNFDIMAYMPVEMHIDGCRGTHDRFYGHKILVHPAEVAFLVPYITIHLGLELLHVGIVELCFLSRFGDSLGHFGVAPQIYSLCIIGSGGKWRITRRGS